MIQTLNVKSFVNVDLSGQPPNCPNTREQSQNSTSSELTIMRRPTEIKTADQTWLDLNQDPIFRRFFAGYLELLKWGPLSADPGLI